MDTMAPRRELFTTMHAVHRTGATFRMIDYWVRTVLQPEIPARGSGTKRLYSFEQVALIRAFVILSQLGATKPVLSLLTRALDDNPDLWNHRVLITRDQVRPVGASGGADGWLISLPACVHHVIDEAA